jgi:hypothetical protein
MRPFCCPCFSEILHRVREGQFGLLWISIEFSWFMPYFSGLPLFTVYSINIFKSKPNQLKELYLDKNKQHKV